MKMINLEPGYQGEKETKTKPKQEGKGGHTITTDPVINLKITREYSEQLHTNIFDIKRANFFLSPVLLRYN